MGSVRLVSCEVSFHPAERNIVHDCTGVGRGRQVKGYAILLSQLIIFCPCQHSGLFMIVVNTGHLHASGGYSYDVILRRL